MLIWADWTASGGGEEAAGRTHLPPPGEERMTGGLCTESGPVGAAAPDPVQRENIHFPSTF